MSRIIVFFIAVTPLLSLAQNTFPSTGTTILNSGVNQNLILRDGRSGVNWNYIQWDFNDGIRDWVLGRRATDGYFTLWRNGINDVLTVDNSGKVGIGTANPAELLHLKSDSKYPRLTVQSTHSNGAPGFDIRDGSGTPKFTWHYDIAGGFMGFFQGSGGGNKLIIKDSGDVGIGTTTPQNKLDVNGTIHSKEVKVDLNNWPDYVFEKNYQLTSLGELKNYIKKNQHLPELPSAQEVEKEGVKLGEMNALLLKKIEEMTLHLIRQQEEIDTLKAELKKK